MISFLRYSFTLIMVIISFSSCTAQDAATFELIPVDIAEYPIYNRVADTTTGDLKEKYKYIHSIDIAGLGYSSDGLKVRGYVVQPKAPGNYPCIIYNRGGNRDFGSLTVGHAVLWLGEMAKEGYVVIASNYRGSPGSEGMEEFGGADVNDVVNLIPVLEQLPNADTEKIGMYGWSRGATMTYLALTKTDRIKAAVAGAGVSNYFDAIENRPNMEDLVYSQLISNYEQNKEAELKKRSAVFFADQFPKDVPILLLHGNADWRVQSENSLKLALEFEKHRIPYRLKIYEGADHGIREQRDDVNKEVMSWFDRFLKDGEALPDMEQHGR